MSAASRRARVPLASTPSRSSSSMLSFDASEHTLVELKSWIAAHQTGLDEQQQRDEEGGTAARRNRAYFERQVRRIQQRRRREEQNGINMVEEEKADTTIVHDEAKAAPVSRRSTSRRTSQRRSASPAAVTRLSASHNAAEADNSEHSSASAKKRKRADSAESSTRRPSKKLADRAGSREERQSENSQMDEEEEAAELSVFLPSRPSAAARLSASSPSSASGAYLDPSLLSDASPTRRAAVSLLSPRSPGNVFQAEQTVHAQLRTGSHDPLGATATSTHKPRQQRHPSSTLSSPAIAAADSSFFSSPPSGTGLHHRLSPSLFDNQPAPARSQRSLTPTTQPFTLQPQRQHREMSAAELRRREQQEEETMARLAAVQHQLEVEKRAKEEAEKERRRLAQQLQQMEQEKRREADKPTPTRPLPRQPSQPLVNSQRPPSPAATSAAVDDGVRERDELGALKAPIGSVARLSAACRRVAAFLLRMLSVMTLLLLALMALQTSPVRRLLGLERDTLFCPSASLPSSVDGMYHGELVRFDGKAQCTACPANGWCDAYGRLQCDRTYVRQNNLCVKDGAWMHRALYLKDQAMALLREQTGRYECREADRRDLTGQQLLHTINFVPWWEALLKSAPRTESEKDEALKQFVFAMRLIEQDAQSVNVTHKPVHDEDILHTSYTAISGNHPLLCHLRLTAWQHKGKLLLSSAVWCAAYYLYSLVQRWLWRRRVRPLLRQRVIAMLQERAGEAVAIDHVRDGLWHKQDSTVWERVVADIDADTRTAPCETKFGFITRQCWRWVGPLPSGGDSSGGGTRLQQDDIGLPIHAAVVERRSSSLFATEPAIADVFAPPNASFSSDELSQPQPAAKQDKGLCVIC